MRSNIWLDVGLQILFCLQSTPGTSFDQIFSHIRWQTCIKWASIDIRCSITDHHIDRPKCRQLKRRHSPKRRHIDMTSNENVLYNFDDELLCISTQGWCSSSEANMWNKWAYIYIYIHIYISSILIRISFVSVCINFEYNILKIIIPRWQRPPYRDQLDIDQTLSCRIKV